MQKRKEYSQCRFSAATIRTALEKQRSLQPDRSRELNLRHLTTKVGHESWKHDSLEEFLADYATCEAAELIVFGQDDRDVQVSLHRFGAQIYTSVAVTGPDRTFIASVFSVFDDAAPSAHVPLPPEPPPQKLTPRVFVGHGRSPVWRDLKDHLHDKHGYLVQAYESSARAGHTIRDILSEIADATDFAILVLTAEDELSGGQMRARQNVIHETGLFQGRLGFNRAIVLMEAGVEEFSNLDGIQQIRFSSNNIKETFGEVVATLKREFGS